MTNGAQSQTVSLGCGTLILIALIVIIFSRPGTEDLEREIRQLRGEVGQLRESIEELRREVKPVAPAKRGE